MTVVLLFCFFRTFLLFFDNEIDWTGDDDDALVLLLRRWRDEEVPTLLALNMDVVVVVRSAVRIVDSGWSFALPRGIQISRSVRVRK
jgi:hypothetical protein